MNPFEQSKQQLLYALTSQVEQEVIDYIRQEMRHDAPDSVPTEDELLTFFQSPDEPTKLDAYQQMLATDKLLEYAEISKSAFCWKRLIPSQRTWQPEELPGMQS